MKPLAVAALLSLCLAAALPAQEPPKPGPEHEKLAATAGTWDAVMEMTTPDGQHVKYKGRSIVKVAAGGFCVIDDYTADFMGQPFQGHGVTGYDPLQGKYVTTWFDSFGPTPVQLTGTFDAAGKVLTMTGTGPGMDGKAVAYKNVTTWLTPDSFRYDIHMGEAGKEQLALTIHYTRKAATKTADDGKAPKDKDQRQEKAKV